MDVYYNNYNIDIIRIIDIIAVILLCLPPEHSSGIWLQILGLTAGMHSYTSEADIAAKYCET